MKPQCCYCMKEESEEVELRPYGPKGAWLCFDCMKLDPEREAEATRQFSAQLDACGDVAVIDGSNVGPMPLEHSIIKALK